MIEAIGLKKTPKGTTRGVFVVDKTGKVLIAEPGGPAATVDAVKKLVADTPNGETKEEEPTAEEAKPTNGEAAEEKDDEEEKDEDKKDDEAEKAEE